VLSALVCTRARPHLLDDCLTSLARALPDGGEILVVEHGDGSSASSVEALNVPATHLLARRGGKSRQLNQGVMAAAHDIVVITDDDCRVEPSWLRAMAAPFADPLIGATFGHVIGLSSVRDKPQRPVAAGPAPAESWAYANGAAMAVRRRAVIEVGGFDERLGPGAPLHGEEHDLILRLQEAGWDVHVAAAPPVDHLEWRDAAETRENLLVYSRGAGAFLGAALRRSPRRWARTAARRVRFQARLWRSAKSEGATFGPLTSWAFLRGLVRGLMLRPRRFL
jgi:GT2 family glycosyltransferase